jgi:hypothetical protein
VTAEMGMEPWERISWFYYVKKYKSPKTIETFETLVYITLLVLTYFAALRITKKTGLPFYPHSS